MRIEKIALQTICRYFPTLPTVRFVVFQFVHPVAASQSHPDLNREHMSRIDCLRDCFCYQTSMWSD